MLVRSFSSWKRFLSSALNNCAMSYGVFKQPFSQGKIFKEHNKSSSRIMRYCFLTHITTHVFLTLFFLLNFALNLHQFFFLLLTAIIILTSFSQKIYVDIVLTLLSRKSCLLTSDTDIFQVRLTYVKTGSRIKIYRLNLKDKFIAGTYCSIDSGNEIFQNLFSSSLVDKMCSQFINFTFVSYWTVLITTTFQEARPTTKLLLLIFRD